MKPKKSVDSVKQELKSFYAKQGSLYCKAVRDNVVFNNYGWKHLTRHSNGKRRIPDDSRMRLYLFYCVPEVIKYCKSVQLTSSQKQIFSGKELDVTYFELAYTFKGKGLRKDKNVIIVLRKIADKKIHYWTVRYNKKAH